MAGSELPGLLEIADRLLLEAVRCDGKCREYVRTCVAGTLLSETLMHLVRSSKRRKVPVEKLYETVASQINHDIALRNLAPAIADILDRVVKYVEMHGGIRNRVATYDSLWKMLGHIDGVLALLGCWRT
ncbi:MAG: hypothetical protein ACO2PN_14310 [Pyrobaculum sp.]|jgi:hypothetical protein